MATHTAPTEHPGAAWERESRGFEPHRDCARSAYQRGSDVAAGATGREMTPTHRPPLLELNTYPTSRTSLFFEVLARLDKNKTTHGHIPTCMHAPQLVVCCGCNHY